MGGADPNGAVINFNQPTVDKFYMSYFSRMPKHGHLCTTSSSYHIP